MSSEAGIEFDSREAPVASGIISPPGGRGARAVLPEQAGFTVVEVLAALAIIVVLAAVVLPTRYPGQDSDMDRARVAARNLAELREAINGIEVTLRPTSFKQNTGQESPAVVGKNPLRLSDLTNRIATTGSNSLNSCGTGNPYLSTEVTRWSSTGPYWSGNVTASGAVIAPGFVAQDLFVVTKVDAANFTTANSSQHLAIRMPSVALTDAQNLAQIVDGSSTGAGLVRTVKFTPSGVAPVQVDYIVLLNNC